MGDGTLPYTPRGKYTEGFPHNITVLNIFFNMIQGEAFQFREIILNNVISVNDHDHGGNEGPEPCLRACRSISVMA